MSPAKIEKQKIEEMWRKKIDHVMAEDIVVMGENPNTLLHIRRGTGSYLTKEMEKEGFVAYAKITEYLMEETNLVLNRVAVLLLKESYRSVWETDRAWLIRACQMELRKEECN